MRRAVVPMLVVYLHGAAGGWDEVAMLGGSLVIGLALVFVLKPKKPDGAVPLAPEDREEP